MTNLVTKATHASAHGLLNDIQTAEDLARSKPGDTINPEMTYL